MENLLRTSVRRIAGIPLVLTYCQRLFLKTSSVQLSPDSDFYDNQAFYPNVRLGFKKGRGNIRNRNYEQNRHRRALQKLTRVRIVDNSQCALEPVVRSARIIDIYNRTRYKTGCVGCVGMITKNGAMKRVFIVGQRAHMGVLRARMDTNNVIVIDKEGNPEGTRVTVPLPAWLRGFDPKLSFPVSMSKIIAITSTFV